MVIVGLTGRSCSGKNCVAKEFQELGCLVIDVDTLGHQALIEQRDKVVQAFGPQVLNDEGAVDRKVLGSLVFGNEVNLRKLEGISHPWMLEACKKQMELAKADGFDKIVLNAALLHRMHLDTLCDVVVFVKAPFWTRYKRAKGRDHVTLSQFRGREASQKDIDIASFDGIVPVVVMDNGDSPDIIHRQAVAFCDTMNK